MEKFKLQQVGKVFVPVNPEGHPFVLTKGPRAGQPAYVCKNEAAKVDLTKARIKSGRWAVSKEVVVDDDFDLNGQYAFEPKKSKAEAKESKTKESKVETKAKKGKGKHAQEFTLRVVTPEELFEEMGASVTEEVEEDDEEDDEDLDLSVSEEEYDNEVEIEAAAQDDGTDEVDALVSKLLKEAQEAGNDDDIDW